MTNEYESLDKTQKKINEIAKKYADKKIILYGKGQFLEKVYDKLDFSNLNIVAISDIKITSEKDETFHGIKCMPPMKLAIEDYDVILTTVINPSVVVNFLGKVLNGKKIKILHLFEKQKRNEWFKNLFSKKTRAVKKEDAVNLEILGRLKNIERKLSMVDNIWQIKNTKFYLPYYPVDVIQRIIVNTNNYFDYEILTRLDKYLPNNAVILDLGANIGNHTLYWTLASSKKAKKVYSFEPVKDTFDILRKNIEINNLADRVVLYNVGLNDTKAKAGYLAYNRANIGATYLYVGDGDMDLCRLDDISFDEEHIDFIKIDVESMEVPLLKGAKETICKYKPTYIFIESAYQLKTVTAIMDEYGYEMYEAYPQQNWLFKLKD